MTPEIDDAANTHGAWWVEFPTQCRDEGCSAAPRWLVFGLLRPVYDPQQVPPNRLIVYGICEAHAPPVWTEDRFDPDPTIVLSFMMRAPATCTLRRGGEPCEKPATHVAVYLRVPALSTSRYGPACRDCVRRNGFEVADGEVYFEGPYMVEGDPS